MPRRSRRVETLLVDVKHGLTDTEIMEKYQISRQELNGSLKTLVAKGQLTGEELELRRDNFLRQIRKLAIIAIFSDDELMNRLVLKGGNALDIAYAMSSRASIDLDFSMSDQFSPEEIVEVERRFKETLDQTFGPIGYTVFDFTFEERPSETTPDMADFWGGYRIEFKIIRTKKYKELGDHPASRRRLAEEVAPSGSKKLRIEISKFEYCESKMQTELDDFTIYVYTPQLIVVEKLRSICQQMPEYGEIVKSQSQSPRPKDFLDIWATIEHFRVDLSAEQSGQLVRRSFEAKKVPLTLISKIPESRAYHAAAFDAVKDTVYSGIDLQDFDFYFDYVVRQCEKLKALWIE